MINKNTIKKTLLILISYKKELLITLFASIVISIIGVIDSLLLCYLIDNVIDSNAKLTLYTILTIMVCIGILQISITGFKNIIIKQISYKMDIKLMQDFYSKILNLNFSFVEKHKSGELVSRFNDTRVVRAVLSEGIVSITANVIIFFVAGSVLFKLNKNLFLILFISVIILVFIVISFAFFFNKEYPVSMEKHADLQAFITEMFSGIESIKTFPSVENFIIEF